MKDDAKLVGTVMDINAVTLDPAKAIAWWSEGRRWRAVSVFVGIAFMWLPFASLYALTRQFAPASFWILPTLCAGALIAFSVLMALTLLKKPAAFAATVLYSLAVIFVATLFFGWLINLSASRTGHFTIGFVTLAVAMAIAMWSNRILKAISLADLGATGDPLSRARAGREQRK